MFSVIKIINLKAIFIGIGRNEIACSIIEFVYCDSFYIPRKISKRRDDIHEYFFGVAFGFRIELPDADGFLRKVDR